MVQHIRKKHPEYQYNSNSIQAPLATTVISSTPAVITTDGTTAEAVVVSNTRSNTTSSNQNIPFGFYKNLTGIIGSRFSKEMGFLLNAISLKYIILVKWFNS